jgi:hypothetical protein
VLVGKFAADHARSRGGSGAAGRRLSLRRSGRHGWVVGTLAEMVSLAAFPKNGGGRRCIASPPQAATRGIAFSRRRPLSPCCDLADTGGAQAAALAIDGGRQSGDSPRACSTFRLSTVAGRTCQKARRRRYGSSRPLLTVERRAHPAAAHAKPGGAADRAGERGRVRRQFNHYQGAWPDHSAGSPRPRGRDHRINKRRPRLAADHRHRSRLAPTAWPPHPHRREKA